MVQNTPLSFTLRSQAFDQSPYVQQRPATSLYRQPSTTGTSPRRRSSPADYCIVVQSHRRDVQSATHLQFVSNRTTAVPATANARDFKFCTRVGYSKS